MGGFGPKNECLIFKLRVCNSLQSGYNTGSRGICAETWRLDASGLKAVEQSREAKYLLAVSELKTLVSMGEKKQVKKAITQLNKDYPEIAGNDFDAFCKAEMFYCEGKFTKASRAYGKLMAEYPESRLYDAAMDRQYSIGKAYLAGHKQRVLKVFKIRGYASGEKVMEKLSDRAGDSPIAIQASVSVVESLESRGKFEEA